MNNVAFDHNWTFGRKWHIEFTGGSEPVLRPDCKLDHTEACATISDSQGALLFYTDGRNLWDANHNQIAVANPVTPFRPLGGAGSSAHTIIIPPAGNGKNFHIIGMDTNKGPLPLNSPVSSPLYHTMVSVSGTSVTIVSGPTALTTGPKAAGEQISCVAHANCRDWWLVSVDAQGKFFAMLLDGDSAPLTKKTSLVAAGQTTDGKFCMKMSHEGDMIAVTNEINRAVIIYNFDRSTGGVTFRLKITMNNAHGLAEGPYGIEFSKNGKYIYYTDNTDSTLNRHDISLGSVLHSTTKVIWSIPRNPIGLNYNFGSLQMGPNGKIYGTKTLSNSLYVIEKPDLVNPAFRVTALAANGSPLLLHPRSTLGTFGLPTFVRIPSACLGDTCELMAEQVESALEQQLDKQVNALVRCGERTGVKPSNNVCMPLQMDDVAPSYHITYGDKAADCIENQQCQKMNITVCNNYSNLTLSALTVGLLQVVDYNGNLVATGGPAAPQIEIVPMGPLCFGDIPPCTCVTREFILKVERADPGRYKILAKAICYDVKIHRADEACFQFNVCKGQ